MLHHDKGDLLKTMTLMHVWGDYVRGKGAQLTVPVLKRAYTMFPDATMSMHTGLLMHYVRRAVIGQRQSC